MEEAIKKAIEAGYIGTQVTEKTWSGINTDTLKKFPQLVLLDPLFWQALQKTQPSWRRKKATNGKEVGKIVLRSPFGYALDKNVEWWEYTMHRFIDHLAQGKSADSFFKDLLYPNN